jgi:undecaprenyl-diphosphatase
MEWLDALILGLVQGLAEYLPISSSGHLEIFRTLLGISIPKDQTLLFDVMVHAATVLSTIVVLRKMFAKLCKSFFTFKRDDDFYYVCKILVSCIPIGIIGLCFKDAVEEFFGEGLTVVGVCLCVTAVLLAFAYYSGINRATKQPVSPRKGRPIGWVDAFVIGCAQACAVLPGLSRSGTTIATGILLRDKRGEVASFSFLMVVLPILGEALLDVKKIAGGELGAMDSSSLNITALIVGFIAAFIVGCMACRWMIDLVKKGKLIWFAVYCLIVGVVCLIFQ